MATGPPKRSWRNVAATPPPPKVLFHVDAPEPYYGLTARQEFMARCIGNVYDKLQLFRGKQGLNISQEKFDQAWMYWTLPERRNAQAMGSIIVYYFEQLMLLAMFDPQFPAHKKMKTGFQRLANQLQCNIAVYLGHIETCPAYVENTYKKIIEKEPPNVYPNTIFLIIGCYGNENAYSLNTDPQYKYFQDRNIAFFGFEDFMHFYDGDIYGCKLLLNKKLNIECEYEGNDADLQKLIVDGLKEPYEIDTLDETNPLFKCCSAKFERILSTFVKELHSRETTKYTMEKLYEKFLPFAQTGDRNLLTKEYTTITSANGIPCNDPVTCPISNPFTTQEAIAKEFNEKAALHILHEELVSYITESSTVEEGHEKVFRRIQNLKGKEKEIFNYRIKSSENPYLIELLEKYPAVGSFEETSKIIYTLFSFIFTKYGDNIDYSMITNGKRNLLQAMIKSKRFSTHHMYTLMKLIFSTIKEEAVRDTLFLNKGVKNGCPLFVEDTILYYQLYIQLFGNKLKDIDYFITAYHKGNLLHKLMSYYISPAEVYKERYNELKECIIGLLMNGVDPNQKLVIDPTEKAKYNELNTDVILVEPYKPLELYTALFFPPYSKTIFVSFYKYGMTNENGFLQKQLEKMKYLRDMNESQVYSYEKVLEALEEYYFYDDGSDYNYYTYENGQQQLGGFRNYYNNNNYNYPYSNNDDREYLLTRLTSDEKKQYTSMTEVYKNFTNQTGFILSSLQFHRMVFKKEIRRPPRVSRVVVNKALFENMIELFNECLRVRRAVGKHGATFRRLRVTNKRNYNKTMKQKFNNLNFNLNPDPILNRLMETILTLAKKPQLTKQEKELYKKRPIQIKQSTVDPKEKRKQLLELLDQLEEVLKSR